MVLDYIIYHDIYYEITYEYNVNKNMYTYIFSFNTYKILKLLLILNNF